LHQDSLKLEKKWVTQNPWFRLATTLIGITVTDTFLLCNYHHKVINGGTSENQEYDLVLCRNFGPSTDPDDNQA
jgi:hypothetical protein